MKITNRGDWMRSRRRVSNRKGWIRVHVAYDIESKQVVDFEVTDESGQGNTNIIFNFKISSSWKKKFLLLS